MQERRRGLSRAARGWSAALCALAALGVAVSAHARGHTSAAVEVMSADGRSWDDVLREIETEPATLGRVYPLGVRVHGALMGCSEYDLALDATASRAFSLEGCDPTTNETRLRVVDRGALFDPPGPGELVPRPRAVSVSALVHQVGTATGGGQTATAGSKIWCSVAIQPYLFDGLHGVTVPLPPDRFELVPLDERVRASPDGSGWIARGESHMDIFFRYTVRDRATGKHMLEDVATLTCADRAVTPPASEDAVVVAPTPLELAPPSPSPAVTMDLRLGVAGLILGGPVLYQELIGVQMGVGKKVSERWYVGATGSWAMALDMGGDSGLTQIFRAGAEARYAFYVRKPGLVGRRGAIGGHVHWLGLRGGLEDVGPSVLGSFADLSWGSESRMGSTALLTVLTAGLGMDGAGAYGDSAILHPYFDFSLGVTFDL